MSEATVDIANKYVVYWCERLRDGTEEGAVVVTGIEAALALANRMKGGINPHCTECLIFKLGEHVPLVETELVVPQPPKTVTGYRLTLSERVP